MNKPPIVKIFLLTVCLGGMSFSAAASEKNNFPDPWEYWTEGIQALEEGRKDQALENIRTAAQLWSSGDPQIQNPYNAALAWIVAEQPAKAMGELHRVLAEDPFQEDAAFNLSRLRKEKGLEQPPWDPGLRPLLSGALWVGASLFFGASLFLLGKGIRKGRGLSGSGTSGLLLLFAGGLLAVILGTVVFWKADLRILAGPVVPRLGDGLYFEEQEGGVWKTGQEILILETRNGWVRGKTLVREGWVQESYLLHP